MWVWMWIYDCQSAFTWVRNDFQESGLIFQLSETWPFLFVLLYFILPSSWHMTFQIIFLSSPPNLLQGCWEYRCTLSHLATYIDSEDAIWFIRLSSLVFSSFELPAHYEIHVSNLLSICYHSTGKFLKQFWKLLFSKLDFS